MHAQKTLNVADFSEPPHPFKISKRIIIYSVRSWAVGHEVLKNQKGLPSTDIIEEIQNCIRHQSSHTSTYLDVKNVVVLK